MSANAPLDEVMIDLLIKRACEGLSAAEQAQLDAFRAANPEQAAAIEREMLGYEQAAAAVTLSLPRLDEPLPEELKAALERDAKAFLAGAAVTRTAVTPIRRSSSAPASQNMRHAAHSYGWWAAAAALVLALFLGTRTAQTPTPTSAAAQRESLLVRNDVLKLDWKPTQEPAAAKVRGDLVWDPKTKTGYMHFVGLAKNDAARQQYQLWIFDAERDERYPVDGGVFDVPAGANEVVVPIHPALPVAKPKLFAVTLEKAGGVVVSGREHIVVTAQPG